MYLVALKTFKTAKNDRDVLNGIRNSSLGCHNQGKCPAIPWNFSTRSPLSASPTLSLLALDSKKCYPPLWKNLMYVLPLLVAAHLPMLVCPSLPVDMSAMSLGTAAETLAAREFSRCHLRLLAAGKEEGKSEKEGRG